MAEALVEFVAANLLSFLQEELATFWGVDSQIQKLSRTLTAISAVLQHAEEKQISEPDVKIWLQQLSDAAYVLDDILDECSIQSNRLQSRNMCWSPKTILFRRGIGKRMKEIVKRFEEMDQERRRYELRPGFVMVRQQEDDHKRRETLSAMPEPHMYGRDQDREQMVEFLLRQASDRESDELAVYPVVGMGGLGKTTLARWVFNDGRVTEKFKLKIWVCVSNNFDVKKILECIVESTVGQNPNLSFSESMQKKVQEVLSSERYLLVLDDVWNEEKEIWDQLKSVLPRGGATKGSSVLVTTRLDRVASIMGTCKTHHLSPLSQDDNWSLFKHHAFGSNTGGSAELEAIGREIVRKCVGNPLASKVLGSLLRDETEEKQWLNIKESKFWDIPEADPIMRALRISYFNLNLSLRRCFSFCAIYPEDYQIEKDQLIHLWMANGFIKSKGKLEAEDVGNKVWRELYQRSFFQEVKIDLLGNTTFKIHDLFHELAQSIMGEECKASDSKGLNDLSTKVHHISCSDSELNIDKHAFKKLESLRTFVELVCLFDCSFGLKAFNNSLRALRTSSSQLSGLGSLTHLRYLNICNQDITTLPKCVSRLKKLQILKLENCKYLSCLPEQLTQLKDLRHLLIRGCDSLVEMPSNIGELKFLKTLNIFVMNSKRQSSLAELRDLQLGGKLHIKGLENVHSESDARSANLKCKKELSELYLSWDCSSNSKCTNSEKILKDLEPHSNLKSFGMKGYMGKEFPSWMMNTSVVSCLVSVILYDCKNCEKLPPLGKLPHLTNLFVSGMEDVKHIDGDSYDGVEKAFKSLKKLTLMSLPNLERILRDETVDMLPLLSELRISCVPKLGLPLLPSVELLNIKVWKSDSDSNMASFLKAIMLSVPCVKSLSISNLSGLNVSVDGLSSLNSLQELQIYDCDELESFEQNVLQGLSSLRHLTIYQCKKLKSLPQGMGHLICLENLTIYDCRELVTLPDNMNQLTALRHVLICGCSTLPEGFQRIPSLESLILHDIEADSLPEWFGDLTSLQLLGIIYCPKIRSLPSSFQHLTNLHELCIDLCPELEKWCKQRTGEECGKIGDILQRQDETSGLPMLTIAVEYQIFLNITKAAGYSEFDELVDDIERMFNRM